MFFYGYNQRSCLVQKLEKSFVFNKEGMKLCNERNKNKKRYILTLSTFSDVQFPLKSERQCYNVGLFILNQTFKINLKGTNCLKKDMGDRSCLTQYETWFQVSGYRNFWNERWKPYKNTLGVNICFTCKNSFRMELTVFQKWLTYDRGFCQKDPNFVQLASSDFVQILQACCKNSKELQKVF